MLTFYNLPSSSLLPFTVFIASIHCINQCFCFGRCFLIVFWHTCCFCTFFDCLSAHAAEKLRHSSPWKSGNGLISSSICALVAIFRQGSLSTKHVYGSHLVVKINYRWKISSQLGLWKYDLIFRCGSYLASVNIWKYFRQVVISPKKRYFCRVKFDAGNISAWLITSCRFCPGSRRLLFLLLPGNNSWPNLGKTWKERKGKEMKKKKRYRRPCHNF